VQVELETTGRELGRAWAIATALRCGGLIEAAAGEPERALSTLREALAWHEQVAQPFRPRAHAAGAGGGAAAGQAAG
jgi:hypothetical protein